MVFFINPHRFETSSSSAYESEVLLNSPDFYGRLGEPSGTTMTDSSGNGRNGTYSGTLTLGSAGLITGDSDTAIVFGGGGGTVTNDTWMSSQTFSVDAWFKPTAVSGYQTIVSRYISGASFTASRWSIRIDNGGNVQFYRFSGSGFTVSTIGTATGGTRYYVGATYDGTNLATYWNGSASTTSSGSMNSTSNDLYVGHAAGAETFGGTIDEVSYRGGTVWGSTVFADRYAAGA